MNWWYSFWWTLFLSNMSYYIFFIFPSSIHVQCVIYHEHDSWVNWTSNQTNVLEINWFWLWWWNCKLGQWKHWKKMVQFNNRIINLPIKLIIVWTIEQNSYHVSYHYVETLNMETIVFMGNILFSLLISW